MPTTVLHFANHIPISSRVRSSQCQLSSTQSPGDSRSGGKRAAGGGGRVGRLVPAPSPEHISLCSDHSWGGAVGPRVAPARVAKPWRLVWPAPRPLWESRWGPPRTGGKPCPGQGLLLAQHCHLPAGLSIAARAPGGEPCLGTGEARRAGVKTRLRGHPECPQCHVECHFQAWKPGPVWLLSPLLISPRGTYSQGELGVTRSARAAGQSPLRTQTLPFSNLPSLHPGEVGCGAGPNPGHRQLGGRAGDIAFCLRSPWFSPLPPYIPRRSPPVWNVRLKFNVC